MPNVKLFAWHSRGTVASAPQVKTLIKCVHLLQVHFVHHLEMLAFAQRIYCELFVGPIGGHYFLVMDVPQRSIDSRVAIAE